MVTLMPAQLSKRSRHGSTALYEWRSGEPLIVGYKRARELLYVGVLVAKSEWTIRLSASWAISNPVMMGS